MNIRHIFDGRYFSIIWHSLKSRRLDKKIGKKDLSGVIPSKFENMGAYGTQSSDYNLLKQMLKQVQLDENDVFVDIGCGQGRVLSYLLMKKYKCKLIGIELDTEVADFAKERLKDYPEIEIINGNALEYLPPDATVFYLFNPFNKEVFREFIFKIEREFNHKVTVIYLFDLYAAGLENREGWRLVSAKKVKRKYAQESHYRILEYNPKNSSQ